jgi:hypothetical protein
MRRKINDRRRILGDLPAAGSSAIFLRPQPRHALCAGRSTTCARILGDLPAPAASSRTMRRKIKVGRIRRSANGGLS